MKVQPEGAATQEGEDDYSTYKAAGKVGSFRLSTSSLVPHTQPHSL